MEISKFWKEVTRSFQLCTWKCYQLIWLWCQLCGWQIFTPCGVEGFSKRFYCYIIGIGTPKNVKSFLVSMFFSWIKENSGWRWNGQCDIILFCRVYACVCFQIFRELYRHWLLYVWSQANKDSALKFLSHIFFVVEKMSKIIGFYFQG